MNSLRMCIACRNMKEKEQLIRVVKIKGEKAELDLTFKAQGRGAYICKAYECLAKAQKSRALERALKTDVQTVYEKLGEIINE